MMPADNVKPIVAFGIVAFVLVTASDFDSTAPLAVAFSGVILLSTALLVGPVAFARISNLVTTNTPPIGGGGKRAKG